MKKLLLSLSSVIALVILIESCTKIRTTELGGGLIPAVDNVTVFDTTLEVITSVFGLSDSTRQTRDADHLFGTLEDPYFGTTSAEMYVQLHPALFGTYPFGSSRDSLIGLDSVVLSLRYKSLYGDSNSVQGFKIYEVDQSAPFRDSSTGYLISHPSFAVSNLIAEKNNVSYLTLNDSLQYIRAKDTVKTVNELRIVLPNEFGMRLMNFDTTIYKTDSAFNTHFKGLAILPDAASALKKAIAYFNLADQAGTRLSFHYRATRNGKADTTVTDFILRTNYRATANLVKRDPSGSPYGNQLANGGDNQSEVFIQSTPGSYSLIKIPGLQNMSNRLLYKAVLIADQLEGYDEATFPTPGLLFLDAVDSAKSRIITIPNSWVFLQNNSPIYYDPGSFGGFLKDKKFQFDLTAYVQGIVTRKEKSYALRLYAPYSTRPVITTISDNQFPLSISNRLGSGRTVIGGGAHPTQKMRLYLVYSRL
ncbi:MAG: DUF4270 family protein [Flavipsychrobacter sp.]|nr:DUF4270 family protein [Flavipsychrobacter sp.]